MIAISRRREGDTIIIIWTIRRWDSEVRRWGSLYSRIRTRSSIIDLEDDIIIIIRDSTITRVTSLDRKINSRVSARRRIIRSKIEIIYITITRRWRATVGAISPFSIVEVISPLRVGPWTATTRFIVPVSRCLFIVSDPKLYCSITIAAIIGKLAIARGNSFESIVREENIASERSCTINTVSL